MSTKSVTTALATLLLATAAACAGDSVGSDGSHVIDAPPAEDPVIDPADDRLLSDEEEAQLLDAIDDICGDSWCAGDFGYSFDVLDCRTSTETCTFSFQYLDGSWEDETRSYDQSCTFENITSKEQISEERHGRLEYSDALYDLVNACINDHENDAYDTFTEEDVARLAAECASADVSWSVVTRVPASEWTPTAMAARAQELGNDGVFPPHEGDLELSVTEGLADDLVSTPECEERFASLLSWRVAVTVEGTNAADEMGAVVLLRPERSWSDHIQEIQIHLGYAN